MDLHKLIELKKLNEARTKGSWLPRSSSDGTYHHATGPNHNYDDDENFMIKCSNDAEFISFMATNADWIIQCIEQLYVIYEMKKNVDQQEKLLINYLKSTTTLFT